MIHYASLQTSDLARSGVFYDAVLAPLGWRRQEDGDSTISWGLTKPAFYLSRNDSQRPGFGVISFPGKSIPAVKAAFASGMENGGEAVAEPGAAPAFGPGNYSARLKDPDGYLVEIVVAPD